MSDNQVDKDIEILRRETGLGQLEADQLMEACNNDVVAAILKHDGVEIQKKPEKELTDAQRKIAELREIVDRKDQKMDAIIQQGKVNSNQN